MNENEFREYLIYYGRKDNREKIPSGSITTILSNIRNAIPNFLNISSIFEYTNIDEINNFYQRIKDSDVDRNNNRNLSNAIKHYPRFLQFKCIEKNIKLYDIQANDFELNDAYWYFKIHRLNKSYPIKAICGKCIKILELDKNFHTNNAKSILEKIFSKESIELIDVRNKEKVNIIHSSKKIKNIILYGSPGVGKTYNTNKLIRLLEDEKSDSEIFETIKNNELSESIDISDIKERVRFITFHQSFGYEDFIEGFRPNEEGNIELTKGIFREICRDAQQNLDDNKKDIFELKKEYTLQNNLENFINYCISKEEKIYLTKTMYINNIDDKAFYYTSNSERLKNIKIPLTDLLLCASHKVTNLQDIKDLDNISGTSKQRPTYIYKLYELFEKYIEINTTETKEVEKVELKNYYLVIDEINRGNISKIFGELITLIEEDKRDKLEVTLPYSKQSFKIPSNLYIIGTMNSTDKSIALIDIALRRRFIFLKMKPNVELVPEDSQELFRKLNSYISKTLGEDYQIGHSYFMGAYDLDFILEYKIKPLLEEYFYGDDKGLKEVLDLITND